jgi:hypothetical protein
MTKLIIFMHKDIRLSSVKDFKIIINLIFFFFLLQFLNYYMMISKLFVYIEIETEIGTNGLETTSLMSMT